MHDAAVLLELIAGRKRHKGPRGELTGTCTAALAELRGDPAAPLPPTAGKNEHSNSSIVFGDKLILKMFRKLERGIHPELEIARVFSEEATFPQTPVFAGALEYIVDRKTSVALGVLQGYVPNTTTAWHFTVDVLGRFFEHVMALPAEWEAQ